MSKIENLTCGSPLGPLKSSGSSDKSQYATSPSWVTSLDRVKSIKLTLIPAVWTLISTPLHIGHDLDSEGEHAWYNISRTLDDMSLPLSHLCLSRYCPSANPYAQSCRIPLPRQASRSLASILTVFLRMIGFQNVLDQFHHGQQQTPAPRQQIKSNSSLLTESIIVIVIFWF